MAPWWLRTPASDAGASDQDLGSKTPGGKRDAANTPGLDELVRHESSMLMTRTPRSASHSLAADFSFIGLSCRRFPSRARHVVAGVALAVAAHLGLVGGARSSSRRSKVGAGGSLRTRAGRAVWRRRQRARRAAPSMRAAPRRSRPVGRPFWWAAQRCAAGRRAAHGPNRWSGGVLRPRRPVLAACRRDTQPLLRPDVPKVFDEFWRRA